MGFRGCPSERPISPIHRDYAEVSSTVRTLSAWSVLVRRRLVGATHLRYMRSQSHSVRLFLACTQAELDVTKHQCQVGTMCPRQADARKEVNRGLGSPTSAKATPLERWELLQLKIDHITIVLHSPGEDQIPSMVCPMGGSVTKVPVRLSAPKGDPRRGS